MATKKKTVKKQEYIEKYYVVTQKNIYQLTRSVRKMVNAGGKVVGGVMIDESKPAGDRGRYMQTITFE